MDMILVSKIESSISYKSDTSFGIVLDNRNTEPSHPSIIKVTPFLNLDADIVVIVYDLSQSASDNRLSYWIVEALKNCP